MSSNVEERIVEMQFDNAKFEHNAKDTIKTLATLEKSLDLKGSTDGLKQIDSAVKSIDFGNIDKGIDVITNKLSVMGVIGDQVLRSLTERMFALGEKWLMAIPKQAFTGGKTRALNIEQAKFQLAGLGVMWDDIYDNIDKAVSGTAYGLDEAAKIASQLAASGIAYGDAESDMAHALRGISGVAAMTNSSYEEIGNIFATIGGQGKLMTFQLRQLESRGLNAAAQLGKVLGKTEQEIRDMVSKGEIDFATFAKAMDEAFGEHSTKANETFTGAFSNMKAAISRIGADFAAPTMEALRKVYNALRETFNGIRKLTRPFAENEFTQWVSDLSDFAVNLIGKLDFSWIEKITATVSAAVASIKEFFGLADKIKFVKPSDLKKLNQLGTELDNLERLTEAPNKNLVNLRKILIGVSAAFDIAKMALSAVGFALKKIMPDWGKIGSRILSAGAVLGDWIVKLRDIIKENDIFNVALNKLGKGLSFFKAQLFEAKDNLSAFLKAFLDVENGKTIWSKFVEWLTWGAERVSSIFNSLKNVLKSVGGWKRIFTGIYESLSAAWNRISPILQSFQNKVMELFGGKGFGPQLFSYAGAIIAAFLGFRKLDATKTSITRLKDSLAALFGTFKNFYADIPGKISWILGQIGGSLRVFSDNLKVDSLKKISTAILILSIGLAILAAIDGEKLGNALVAAAGGLTMLLGAFKLLQGNKMTSIKDWFLNRGMYTNIIQLSIAILIIAVAIKSLAKSVERLGTMDIGSLRNGLIGVLALITAVGAFTNSISKQSGLSPKIGIAIIAMAIGISILSKAVERLSALNPDELMTGLAGVLGLLYAISVIGQNMAKGNGLTPKAGVGVIAMAAGILILVKAVEMLGNLENAGTLESGLFALGALMAMVTAMGYYLRDTKNIVGIGISMIAFGAAMKIMVSALEGLSNIGDIYTPLAAIGMLLAMIAAFSVIVSKGVTGFGAISIALIAFSASLMIFAAAMTVLSKLSWSDVGKGLAAIGGALIILGVAAVALSGFIPALLAVSGALALLGVGIFLVSAGVALLSAALITLAAAGAAGAASIVGSITIIANGLLGLVGTLTTGVALFITGLIVALAKSASAIARALADMIISVIGTLAASAPELVKSIAELLINMFVSLGDYAPQIIEGAFNMLDKVLAGLVDSLYSHAGNIFAAVGEVLNVIIDGSLGIIAGVLSTVGEYSGQVLGAIGGAIGEVFGEIVGGLLEGISSHFDEIATNMDSFLEAISPFVERLNTLNIDPAKIEALKSIAEAILVLTEAKIIDGLSNITSFLTGGKNSFADFAKELAYMGPAMTTYSKAVADVDSDAIAKSATAITALANVSKSLGRNGGLISAALGKSVTLSEFATQLVASIPGIKAFADAAPTIASNASSIEQVAGVIESIVKVANKLNPEHTELLWGAYVKDAQNLGDFMRQFSDSVESIDGVETTVKGIGSNLVEFSNSMQDVSVESLDKGKDAIAALVALAEPLQGKTNTLSVFGSDIWTSETTSGLVSMLGGLAEVIPLLNTAFKDMEALEVTKFDLFSKSLEKIVSTEVLAKENDAFGGRLQAIASFLIDSALSFKEAGERISEISFEDINTLFAWLEEHNDDLVAKGTQAVKAVQDGMNTAASLGAIDVANNTVTPVMEQIASAANLAKARNAGKFLVDGFAAGITANIHTAMAAAGNLSEATIQQMRRTLRIGSPSRVARQIGDWTGEGFTIGVSDWLHASGQVGESLAESVTKSAEATVDYLTRLLNGDMVVSMTIHPVLDLTDVRNGAMTIDSMFTQRQALMAQLDSSAMDQSAEIAELVNVSWQILREIQNGRDIYLDGKVLAGSMNRRLGRMEGL